EDRQHAEVEYVGEPALAEGLVDEVVVFRQAHDEHALVALVLLAELVLVLQHHLAEIGKLVQLLERRLLALHEDAVAGTQRDESEVREAIAAAADDAGDADVEAVAEPGFPDQL